MPLSWVYRLLAGAHRLLGRWQARSRVCPDLAPVPLVVVGNWVVGGAGKTPTTLALVQHLQREGWTPGIVSRGHGRLASTVQLIDAERDDAASVGDEPLLLARRSGVPVCVGRDRRVALALLRKARPEVDIVLSDDGLQHHRLPRDLEVVVADARGRGNGLCLPAGPLRQPVPAQLPDNTLLLYTSGRASLDLPGHAAQRVITDILPWRAWREGGEGVQPCEDDRRGWALHLRQRPVHAVAGVADPTPFFLQLRELGLAVTPIALRDHDPMDTRPWPQDAQDVVMTEKDAVKAHRWAHGHTRLWVARLDLAVDATFWTAFKARLQHLRPG